jgi:D-alanyl-D-alanine carboxypeptidase
MCWAFSIKRKVYTPARVATILLLTSIMVCCGSSAGESVLSEEELRVAASRHLDSTAVRTLAGDTTGISLVPDTNTVALRELLDGLSAEAWILVEDSTGLLLSAKNAHKRMFPASLTKMMTAMLAIERGAVGDTIEITDDVFLSKDSRVRLGDRYLLGNMICEMMLQSDNDAANAIAKHLGGDIPSFCQMMNEKAAYLGMDSTHFANPNGLPSDSTFSSAHDLLVLSRYCMRDSAFAEIAGTAFMDIPLVDGRHLSCQNTNLLLDSYEGCIGVKTGYTRRAGSCLASAATRRGVTLFLILLNSKSRSSRFTESAILLDYGFRVINR